MAISIFGRYRPTAIFAALVVAAASFIAALPARAIAFVRDLFVGLTDPRPFRDLFETPALALDGPGDSRSISPWLAHDQKHEAGLARLGTVRHR